MSDIRNYVCETCEYPLIVCSCAPEESKPMDYPAPADEPAGAPRRGEPTCDMCVAKGEKGRLEAIRGNGDTAYVCDTCGWLSEVVSDDEWDDDELRTEQTGVPFVNLGEAFNIR